MCDPIIYAGVMMISAHQQQEAQMKMADDTNAAAKENAKRINNGYADDIVESYDTEISIRKQAWQDSEAASMNLLKSKIAATKKQSMWNVQTLEGGVSNAGWGALLREEADEKFNIDTRLNAQFATLEGERTSLVNKRRKLKFDAGMRIRSLKRDPGLTSSQRNMGVVMAGVSGYSMGSKYAVDDPDLSSSTTASIPRSTQRTPIIRRNSPS